MAVGRIGEFAARPDPEDRQGGNAEQGLVGPLLVLLLGRQGHGDHVAAAEGCASDLRGCPLGILPLGFHHLGRAVVGHRDAPEGDALLGRIGFLFLDRRIIGGHARRRRGRQVAPQRQECAGEHRHALHGDGVFEVVDDVDQPVDVGLLRHADHARQIGLGRGVEPEPHLRDHAQRGLLEQTVHPGAVAVFVLLPGL